jgi:hypothetical protein
MGHRILGVDLLGLSWFHVCMKTFALLLFFVSMSSLSLAVKVPAGSDAVLDRDYEELFRQCAGASCCEASVRKAEKAQGLVIKPKTFSCPEGFTPNSLQCVGSYKWCEPKPSDQK